MQCTDWKMEVPWTHDDLLDYHATIIIVLVIEAFLTGAGSICYIHTYFNNSLATEILLINHSSDVSHSQHPSSRDEESHEPKPKMPVVLAIDDRCSNNDPQTRPKLHPRAASILVLSTPSVQHRCRKSHLHQAKLNRLLFPALPACSPSFPLTGAVAALCLLLPLFFDGLIVLASLLLLPPLSLSLSPLEEVWWRLLLLRGGGKSTHEMLSSGTTVSRSEITFPTLPVGGWTSGAAVYLLPDAREGGAGM